MSAAKITAIQRLDSWFCQKGENSEQGHDAAEHPSQDAEFASVWSLLYPEQLSEHIHIHWYFKRRERRAVIFHGRNHPSVSRTPRKKLALEEDVFVRMA
uniref:hypothetical protein n=1 Tax=Parolsenella massiliensis TaxID=1871022 RepID=UPI0012FECB91|nr:hypothetical protein [Parolsenella massiliensis]